MRSLGISGKLAGAITVFLGWPLAVVAGSGSAVGDQALMLTVKVIAGASAGQSYSLTDAAGRKPLLVTFVDTANDMVADYAKRLDRSARRHRKSQLATAVIFLGDAAKDEARLKSIAETRKLRYVSLAVVTNSEQLAHWNLDTTKPTNAYIVKDGRIAKHYTAQCPLCDKLPGRLSTGLWTMLAAGRRSWGYLVH